jgi:hypothetical protein
MKMPIQIRYSIALVSLLVIFGPFSNLSNDQAHAQQAERIPAMPAFESAYLISGQTVTMQRARTLEFAIQHRFGEISRGSFDMFGLYAPSNDIRMGINYNLTDRIQIGIGSTKGQMMQDINWKWLVLQQSRDDAIPVSIAYVGNSAISVREAPEFYPEFSNRLSYYQELMVARRFNEWFSLQVSGSYAHFNMVEAGLEHDNLSVAARSKVGLTPALSVLLEYEQPLTSHENASPEANFGTGIEYATRGHQFQVFVSNYSSLMPQRNMLYNTNNPADFDFLIGFNITRRWNL